MNQLFIFQSFDEFMVNSDDGNLTDEDILKYDV